MQIEDISEVQETVTLCLLHDKHHLSPTTFLPPPPHTHTPFPPPCMSLLLRLFLLHLLPCPRSLLSHRRLRFPLSAIPLLSSNFCLFSRVLCFVSVCLLPPSFPADLSFLPSSSRLLQTPQSNGGIQVGEPILSSALILSPRHPRIPSRASSPKAVTQTPH